MAVACLEITEAILLTARLMSDVAVVVAPLSRLPEPPRPPRRPPGRAQPAMGTIRAHTSTKRTRLAILFDMHPSPEDITIRIDKSDSKNPTESVKWPKPP